MAETDARIQDLTPVSSVGPLDLFVLEQAGAAMSLSGELLMQSLADMLEGHGGISDITYTAPTSGSLTGTMTVTLADGDATQFSITNGRGISDITYTAPSSGSLTGTVRVDLSDGTSESFSITNGRGIDSIEISDSGTSGDGAVHTGTIHYNDNTTQQFQFRDGVQGDPGQDAAVYFAWADVEPSSDADIYFDHTGPFIGICSTLSSTAPTDFAAYSWYGWKGPTGEDGASIQSIQKTYTSGLVDTYTVTLTDGTTNTFTVTNAKSIVNVQMTGGSTSSGATAEYTITYNDGDTFTFYVYNGLNGSGGVSSVSGIQADGNGDVPQVRTGNGPPSTASGFMNQLYIDLSTGAIYLCVGNVGGSWSWISAGQITVDSALSTVSTNPVQNSTITAKVGTAPLDTTAQDLSGAVNELLSTMPQSVSDLTNDVPYLSMGLGTLIPDSSDLDNYTTPGVFYAGSNSGIHSSPTTGAFRLEVIYVNGTTRPMQRVYELGLASMTFTRCKTSAGWQPWRRQTVQTAETLSVGSADTGISNYGYATYDPNSSTVRVYLTARNTSANIPTTAVLGTIPAGYRPSADTYLAAFFAVADGTSHAHRGVVKTDGTIHQSFGNTIREVLLVGEYTI